MVDIRKSIRFLSGTDLDTLGLGMGEIIDILEAAFRAKAAGKVIMAPKIFFHRDGPRFYSSMVSASPEFGYAGCKWQSGRSGELRAGPALHPGPLHPDRGRHRANVRRH